MLGKYSLFSFDSQKAQLNKNCLTTTSNFDLYEHLISFFTRFQIEV